MSVRLLDSLTVMLLSIAYAMWVVILYRNNQLLERAISEIRFTVLALQGIDTSIKPSLKVDLPDSGKMRDGSPSGSQS